MSITPYDMTGCKRCPTCQIVPEPMIETSRYSKTGFCIVLRCLRHGHVAQGDTVAQAVKHWNYYITHAVIHRAAESFLNNVGLPMESFCIVCDRNTLSIIFPGQVECARCYVPKLFRHRSSRGDGYHGLSQ